MKLDVKYFLCAIDHVIKYGDTDIFPHPFEIQFIKERRDDVAQELSKLDLNRYHPMSVVESLVPKSRHGFRVAHQPFLIDTTIYTALVLSIFDAVESRRDPQENNRAFSYRKVPGLNPSFFLKDHAFRNWLKVIEEKVHSDDYSHVIRTDISDYYPRIYRHRLENVLDSLSGEPKIVKRIESFISDWRGRQSFGLPVGSSASRLLAEAALHDTDMGLISEGYEHTRYVDDMCIFVKKDQDPYAALGYLAKQLMENEGLSLNIQKTKVLNWDEFVKTAGAPEAGDDDAKEKFATEKLFWAAYTQDETDQEALNALIMKDLRGELEGLLNETYWDPGQIRIVLHAMRLTKNADVAKYIRNNLAKLIPFAKDVCLLIEAFVDSGISGFEDMGPEVTELLLSPRMRPLDCARAWFLELAVRKCVIFESEQIRKLDTLSGMLDLRQMHLIRKKNSDVNFFRSWKTKFDQVPPLVQPSLILGASCLPRDDYAHWLKGIKYRVQFPMGKIFVDWCGKVQKEN